MSHNTIKAEWDSYYAKVLRPSGVQVGSTQYIETRRAFYAGMQSLFGMVMEAADRSEEAAEALLQSWDAELKDFAKNVGKNGL